MHLLIQVLWPKLQNYSTKLSYLNFEVTLIGFCLDLKMCHYLTMSLWLLFPTSECLLIHSTCCCISHLHCIFGVLMSLCWIIHHSLDAMLKWVPQRVNLLLSDVDSRPCLILRDKMYVLVFVLLLIYLSAVF